MKALQQDFYLEEIDRCARVYQDFKEAVPFITSVINAISGYIKKHEEEFKPFDYNYVEQEASDAMRATQTLDLNPDISRKTVTGLFKAISDAVTGANPSLKKTMKDAAGRWEELLAEYPEKISKEDILSIINLLTKETDLEKDMATFLYSLVLSTIYRRQLEPISEVLRTDLWEGGICPLCGDKPHFGMLRAEDGAKQLECWLCGTTWVHTRIKCPFCENQEQEELGYFTIEGNDTCRVNFCKSCLSYYKVFDARKFHADGSIILTIHNLATLDHDFLAGKEGFTPGSGLEWVNEQDRTGKQV